MHALLSAVVLSMVVLCPVAPAWAQQSGDDLPFILESLDDEQLGADETNEHVEEWASELQFYLQHPLDLNEVTAEQLSVFPFLNPLQVEAFLSYRKLLGRLSSVYELQAIPGWDVTTIHKLLPFVRVAGQSSQSLNVLQKPTFQGLTRYQRVFPRSWGYIKSTGSRYMGAPDAWLMKVQGRGEHYRAGLTAEKDAGEPLFRSFNSRGFDHYGAYLEIKGRGMAQQVLLGDYEVNLGQGLISWQSFSLSHSAYSLQMEKSASALRPHSGTAEYGYYRGIAFHLRESRWQQVAFVSLTSPGAYWDSADGHRIITSWEQTGYHRTLTESTHRGVAQLFATGGRIGYDFPSGHLALNGVYHRLTVPVLRSQQTYNQYAFAGDVLYNVSVDYAWSLANQHWFGELAWCKGNSLALLQGWMMQLSQTLSMGLLYRHYARAYHAFYANGFGVSGETTNETGGYLATEIRRPRLQLNAYADVFHFPWWRYQISGPMTGTDDLIRVAYQPVKASDHTLTARLQLRYRLKARDLKTPSGKVPVPTHLWQSQLGWQWEQGSWQLAWRGFYHVFRQTDSLHQRGMAMYGEFGQHAGRRLSWNTRLAWFHVPGYEARIYVYEQSVLYLYSYPFYYHTGWRAYLNLRYKPGRHLTLELHGATTWYTDQQQIGSGLDRIDGSKKFQLVFQILSNW